MCCLYLAVCIGSAAASRLHCFSGNTVGSHTPLVANHDSQTHTQPHTQPQAIEYGMIDKVLTTPMPKMPSLGPTFKFERQGGDSTEGL